MLNLRALMVMLVIGLGLMACDGKPAASAGKAATDKVDPVFLADNQIWRNQRREQLTQPDGWTSLVGLHWLELKAHYVGSSAASGIRLAVGPAKLGMISQQGKQVFFTPEKDVPLTYNGEPLNGRVPFLDDRQTTPGVIGFDDGKGSMSLIERGGRHALRIKHADAISRTGFAGLQYWPADPRWQVEGRFIPHPAGKTIPIVDITGMTTPSPNPGVVEFERDGVSYRLEALGEAGGELFLVFADRTSGHGSYPAGRFLDAPAPVNGKVVIDFNRAYNPPCAFTPFATCPLPPPENRLDLRVDAGEMNYKSKATTP